MCVILQAVSMPFYRQSIELTDQPFKRTETEMIFSYVFDGKETAWRVQQGEEAAELLYRHGFISGFVRSIFGFKMYQTSSITVPGPKGKPVEWERTMELEWNKIKFTNKEIIEMCAEHEYTIKGKLCGLVEYKEPAKIRGIDTKYNKAA